MLSIATYEKRRDVPTCLKEEGKYSHPRRGSRSIEEDEMGLGLVNDADKVNRPHPFVSQITGSDGHRAMWEAERDARHYSPTSLLSGLQRYRQPALQPFPEVSPSI